MATTWLGAKLPSFRYWGYEHLELDSVLFTLQTAQVAIRTHIHTHGIVITNSSRSHAFFIIIIIIFPNYATNLPTFTNNYSGCKNDILDVFWPIASLYALKALCLDFGPPQSISSDAQFVTMWKYFSHPSFVVYSFATPPRKLKLGQQIGGRLLITNHLDQSLWWAD
jgi:hypothetical protein